MIYLDANAFYWYLGREKLFVKPSVPKHNVEKLNCFLDTRQDKSIPATVLIEMIVHFRDDPKLIMKIITFIKKKKMRILNNFSEHCFTSDELTALYITKEDSWLKQYAYSLLDKKIEVEVRHAYTFLQIVSLLYADYYLKSFDSLNGETRDGILSYLGKNLSDEMREDLCSELTIALNTGYADNNKSEQALKKKYIELLVQNCVIFQMLIDTAVKFLENENELYEVMCKSANDAKNNGFTDDGIMEIIKKALNTDSLFLKIVEAEIPAIFQRKGYSKHQADYLKTMLIAWLERGKKLVKNDIFDMLCVGVLDKSEINPSLNPLIDQSSYLISFDEMMMKFLFNDSANARLIQRFLNS